MKKILAVILSVGMLLSLCACGGNAAISKKKYESMTADDLFNAVVKSPDIVTVDEYIAIVETYSYADIAASVMELEKNITDEVLQKITSEYATGKRPATTEWVPTLITHKSPQVRGKAFGSAYAVYKDSPEFVTAAKEVMKKEKEPHVIFFMLQGLPTSIVAQDSEIAAFVQEMTNHENERIRKIATMKLEDVAKANQ